MSHGELVRASNNERMELDPCRLQLLTQSIDAATTSGTDYGALPYKLGVLTPRSGAVRGLAPPLLWLTRFDACK